MSVSYVSTNSDRPYNCLSPTVIVSVLRVHNFQHLTPPLVVTLRCYTNELGRTVIEVIKWRGRGPRKPYM